MQSTKKIDRLLACDGDFDIEDNDENFNEQNEKNQGLEGLGLLHGGDWDKKLLQNTQDYGYDGEESEEEADEEEADEEDETKSKKKESEENHFNFDSKLRN